MEKGEVYEKELTSLCERMLKDLGQSNTENILRSISNTYCNGRYVMEVLEKVRSGPLLQILKTRQKDGSFHCVEYTELSIPYSGDYPSSKKTFYIGDLEVCSNDIEVLGLGYTCFSEFSNGWKSLSYNEAEDNCEEWEPSDFLDMMKTANIYNVSIRAWLEFLGWIGVFSASIFLDMWNDQELDQRNEPPRAKSARSALPNEDLPKAKRHESSN